MMSIGQGGVPVSESCHRPGYIRHEMIGSGYQVAVALGLGFFGHHFGVSVALRGPEKGAEIRRGRIAPTS
jgi:hypothetical protein